MALQVAGAVPLERRVDGARKHAAALLPVVGDLLAEAGVTLQEVDALAIADGPGSFTGLRVSAALAKSLSSTHPAIAFC